MLGIILSTWGYKARPQELGVFGGSDDIKRAMPQWGRCQGMRTECGKVVKDAVTAHRSLFNE